MNFYFYKIRKMKSGKINFHLPLTVNQNQVLVLRQELFTELQSLTASLRKQMRNVVAVSRWIHDKSRELPADQDLARRMPELVGHQPEVLSFQLAASPAAFRILGQILQRRHHPDYPVHVDPDRQVVQLKVNYRHLAAWEYQWSLFFENIRPADYLQMILAHPQPVKQEERKAS